MSHGGVRRRARCFALQVLYALDVNRDEQVERALSSYVDAFELRVGEPSLAFARTLVKAAAECREDIDEAIQSASRNWRIERMSRVDRNILRLATCELRHVEDAPVRVVINEAVELAKLFGAGESAAFVNGILDRVAQRTAAARAAAGAEATPAASAEAGAESAPEATAESPAEGDFGGDPG